MEINLWVGLVAIRYWECLGTLGEVREIVGVLRFISHKCSILFVMVWADNINIYVFCASHVNVGDDDKGTLIHVELYTIVLFQQIDISRYRAFSFCLLNWLTNMLLGRMFMFLCGRLPFCLFQERDAVLCLFQRKSSGLRPRLMLSWSMFQERIDTR